MPTYFAKLWHTGTDRENPGEVMDPQPDWPKPVYRPGWKVAYTPPSTRKVAKQRVGLIRSVFREIDGTLDFYRVIRLKTDLPEITFESSILKRIKDE